MAPERNGGNEAVLGRNSGTNKDSRYWPRHSQKSENCNQNTENFTCPGETSGALRLDVSKCREHMFMLLMANLQDDLGIIVKFNEQHSKLWQAHVVQIIEMTAAMRKATETEHPRCIK